MKKITIFGLNSYSIFNPLNNKALIGGGEVDIYNISIFLSLNGFNVTVIVGDFGQNNIEYIKGIKLIKSIKSEKNGIFKGLINIFKIFNLFIKSNPDILFFEAAGYYLGIGVLYKFFFRKKIIFRTAHDEDCNGDYIKNNGIFGIIYKFGLLNVDKVITQNIENKNMLFKFYRINAEIINNFYQVKKNNIKSYNDRKYILWVARCETWKKPELFLDLVEKNPEKNFLMISPRKEEKIDFFNHIIYRAKKINNLKFIEKVPFNKIQDYYNNALCFIGTSDYEGFPNTYIQSCLGGTPILSLNVNPSLFITKNNIGYVCDGDINIMNKKLKYILNEKNGYFFQKMH